MLAHPETRQLPPKGLDAFAARLRGAVARRRATKADRRRAERIVEAATKLRQHSDAALDDLVAGVAERVRTHRDDPRVLNEAYAAVHEVVRRETGLALFVEQVMGAVAMAEGCCAEMATGEGKTITAVLPAAINGWLRQGVHVHTVNDYLARRDADITRACHRRLGLRVGVVQDKSTPEERREAYACDITYGADKQFIFDFLRDRLHAPLRPRLASTVLDDVLGTHSEWTGKVVQRGLACAIVDEADSVLIDEAVTPAIIGLDAAAGEDQQVHFRIAAGLAAELEQGAHFEADIRLRVVRLTDAGREAIAQAAHTLPPFWAGPIRREELVVQALAARHLYRKDDDYIVREGKVQIVDASTGRILEGRQWQLGVHQAVEAKEGLEVSTERRTNARISYQRFFQRYRRLSGMSGTVWEVAPELWRDYGLRVVKIPTHRPVQRIERADRIFADEASKIGAVVERVIELHGQKRPVLVGTRSVITSEQIGNRLAEAGVPCRILNAVREAEEAAIVAEAGQPGAVTVATNMAGRGTDILLTPFTRELGGLVVLSTERNEERRVDRQLFGRSGRQGDPGLAQAFVALSDRLVAVHGLKPLTWACRVLPAGVRTPLARLLWTQCQWSASRSMAIRRFEAAKHDAWIDMAMHHESK